MFSLAGSDIRKTSNPRALGQVCAQAVLAPKALPMQGVRGAAPSPAAEPPGWAGFHSPPCYSTSAKGATAHRMPILLVLFIATAGQVVLARAPAADSSELAALSLEAACGSGGPPRSGHQHVPGSFAKIR